MYVFYISKKKVITFVIMEKYKIKSNFYHFFTFVINKIIYDKLYKKYLKAYLFQAKSILKRKKSWKLEFVLLKFKYIRMLKIDYIKEVFFTENFSGIKNRIAI